jgi:stalled ribosome rescue protein Dom34
VNTLPTRLSLVWISPDLARIFFRLENEPISKDPNTHTMKRAAGDLVPTQFFLQVSGTLKNCRKIVIVGPCMAKFHFRTFLQEHEPDLYRRILGFETGDVLSPSEASEYLTKYDR